MARGPVQLHRLKAGPGHEVPLTKGFSNEVDFKFLGASLKGNARIAFVCKRGSQTCSSLYQIKVAIMSYYPQYFAVIAHNAVTTLWF